MARATRATKHYVSKKMDSPVGQLTLVASGVELIRGSPKTADARTAP